MLYVAAMGSLGFYGMLIGGWASGSKYSLLGGLRAVAQLVSYEVAFTLAVLGVIMQAGTLSLHRHRRGAVRLLVHRPAVPRLRGLLHRRAGRDPTARRSTSPRPTRELVAGFHTEYGGMRYAMFANAEYIEAIVLSALGVGALPGRLARPGAARPDLDADQDPGLFLFVFFWIRATVPRVRFDRLMQSAGRSCCRSPPSTLVGTAAWVALDMSSQSKNSIEPSRASPSRSATSSGSPSRSSTRSTSARSSRASAAATACTATRTGSRSASAARSAPRPARPTASASCAAENEPGDRVSAGERYARIYEINMARCIFCGYCEIACPFDAITLGNDFELSETRRDALIYTKEMLLEPPIRRTPVDAAGGYDRGAQEADGAACSACTDVVTRRTTTRCPATDGRAVIFYLVRASSARSAPRSPSCCQRNPFQVGALALRAQPGLAGGAVPRAAGRLRGGGAGARLRRRGDGHVPLRHRLPGRPRGRTDQRRHAVWRSGLAIVAAAAILARDRGRGRVGAAFDEPGLGGRRVRQPGAASASSSSTDYLLAFEVVSLLLLVAAVAGVVLGAGPAGRSAGELPPRDDAGRGRRARAARCSTGVAASEVVP